MGTQWPQNISPDGAGSSHLSKLHWKFHAQSNKSTAAEPFDLSGKAQHKTPMLLRDKALYLVLPYQSNAQSSVPLSVQAIVQAGDCFESITVDLGQVGRAAALVCNLTHKENLTGNSSYAHGLQKRVLVIHGDPVFPPFY